MNRDNKTSKTGGTMDGEERAGIEGGVSPNRDEFLAPDEFWTRPRPLRPKLRSVFWAGLSGRPSAEKRNSLPRLAQIQHTAIVPGN